MIPKTRKEHYLAKIAGEDVAVPEPITRDEYFLKEIAENGGIELPAVTSEQAGQVLTVSAEGAWEADTIPSQLPTVTSTNEGEVLTVNAQGEWEAADAPTGLPEVTAADDGSSLKVVSGEWAKVAPPEEPVIEVSGTINAQTLTHNFATTTTKADLEAAYVARQNVLVFIMGCTFIVPVSLGYDGSAFPMVQLPPLNAGSGNMVRVTLLGKSSTITFDVTAWQITQINA